MKYAKIKIKLIAQESVSQQHNTATSQDLFSPS